MDVRQIGGTIGKGIRIHPATRRQWRIERIFRRMFEAVEAFKHKLVGRGIEIRDTDAISEHVVHVTQIAGLRRDFQTGIQHMLIKTLARTKHHPMLAELHWLGIAVTRKMTDSKNIHSPELLVATRAIT